jgi:hypothetical protein
MAKPTGKAVAMLVEEVEKRTRIRWQTATEWPAHGPVVAVGTAEAVAEWGGKGVPQIGAESGRAEGYRIVLAKEGERDVVFVIGNDARGVLFGVGRLLRLLRLRRDEVALPAEIDISTAPHYPLRGHQLGYRPKTHSYDGWSLPLWEQYLRDLAVFGCNAVELIPPHSDDAPTAPISPCRRWP